MVVWRKNDIDLLPYPVRALLELNGETDASNQPDLQVDEQEFDHEPLWASQQCYWPLGADRGQLWSKQGELAAVLQHADSSHEARRSAEFAPTSVGVRQGRSASADRPSGLTQPDTTGSMKQQQN